MMRSHRDEFSRKVKAQICLRAGGRCEDCSAKLKIGEGEVDHILPVIFGGEPTIENGRLLCKVCHKIKTGKDIGSARKSERIRDKQSGAMRSKRPMFGSRDSPWKIRMNGEVVRRDA